MRCAPKMSPKNGNYIFSEACTSWLIGICKKNYKKRHFCAILRGCLKKKFLHFPGVLDCLLCGVPYIWGDFLKNYNPFKHSASLWLFPPCGHFYVWITSRTNCYLWSPVIAALISHQVSDSFVLYLATNTLCCNHGLFNWEDGSNMSGWYFIHQTFSVQYRSKKEPA